ncbi:hypothetical protein TNCV_2504271 [Trichonephila clavipes]|uniref:Uncharacterized protein n=1 Tax=Trichonephila clavipes TaxID=2585209 RepID=A0A8X6WGW4_TRICX|nr:hypothetical protein TNCV_2504271 [Trichonephila clavipes]
MANVFTVHEPNRACLGHSMQMSCCGRLSPLPSPQTFLELERALLEEWYRIPSSSLIDSLTPCLKEESRESRTRQKSRQHDLQVTNLVLSPRFLQVDIESSS